MQPTPNHDHPPVLYTHSFPDPQIRKEDNAETYFPTEQPSPRENPRFSDPHEDRKRPSRSLPPPRHRPQEADCQLGEVVGYFHGPSLGPRLRASRTGPSNKRLSQKCTAASLQRLSKSLRPGDALHVSPFRCFLRRRFCANPAARRIHHTQSAWQSSQAQPG